MSFEIENGVLNQYTEEPGITEVVIPDGVTQIAFRAFARCKGMTSVLIPDSVESIEPDAFSECTGLTSVRIPGSVKVISYIAFANCTGLETLVISSGVEAIMDDAFVNCTRLRSVTIEDGLDFIGRRVFEDCASLQSVCVPDSVTVIDQGAFPKWTSFTYLGYTFKGAKDALGRREIRAMIADRDYEAKVGPSFKYPILWKFLEENPEDAELLGYIKKRFARMFEFAIDTGNTDAAAAVCRQGSLLTARNIDKFIDYAVQQKQPEIQVMLLNYKNETIGYQEKPLKL